VVDACHELGLWPFAHFNGLHIAPPLVISAEDLEDGISRLDRAMSVADEYCRP